MINQEPYFLILAAILFNLYEAISKWSHKQEYSVIYGFLGWLVALILWLKLYFKF